MKIAVRMKRRAQSGVFRMELLRLTEFLTTFVAVWGKKGPVTEHWTFGRITVTY
jgi:hypothetical protein